MPRASDPIVVADELCELLADAKNATRDKQLETLLAQLGDGTVEIISEVHRRGFLTELLTCETPAEGEVRIAQLLSCAHTTRALQLLALELVSRKARGDRDHVEQLILHAESQHLLGALFAEMLHGGAYERLCELLCSDGVSDSPSLRALAQSRPTYDAAKLNAAALQKLSAGFAAKDYEYDLLIVPGYTPVRTDRPMHISELPPMQQRVELAAHEFLDGRAPFVFVTGGSVHPAGTPHNEALMMREQLMDQGVSPSHILVDPHARHTTTNLRNAGRLMLDHSLSRGLIITGFDSPVFSQAFYLGNPNLSTFLLRCRRELGYSVGELTEVDEHRIEFTPSSACTRPTYFDPIDV